LRSAAHYDASVQTVRRIALVAVAAAAAVTYIVFGAVRAAPGVRARKAERRAARRPPGA
jgi:hypothetical protein